MGRLGAFESGDGVFGAVRFFDVREVGELFGRGDEVDFVQGAPDISCFRAEEEHEDELDHEEDLEEVEQPEPAERGEDLAADDRGEGGRGVQDEVHGGDAGAALMHEEEVADCGYEERFKGAGCEALDDARREKIFVADSSLANGCADNV